MNDTEPVKHCLNCNRSVEQVPLISIEHRDGAAHICPQCLPILLHQPQMLVGKLPGAESLRGHSH